MSFVQARISVFGLTESEVREGMTDLLDELHQRSWIINPKASWDTERECLIVTTHYEGTNTELISRAALDEVRDCVIACLKFSSRGIQFDRESTSIVQHADLI